MDTARRSALQRSEGRPDELEFPTEQQRQRGANGLRHYRGDRLGWRQPLARSVVQPACRTRAQAVTPTPIPSRPGKRGRRREVPRSKGRGRTGTGEVDGEALYTNRASVFIRGEGGWGGERGPSGPQNEPPDRPPDHEVTYQTSPDQALVYRLSGDRNPLHSDPAFAAMGGFDRPILHGLCSYGFTGRALLHSLCESDGELHHIEARSRHVMPASLDLGCGRHRGRVGSDVGRDAVIDQVPLTVTSSGSSSTAPVGLRMVAARVVGGCGGAGGAGVSLAGLLDHRVGGGATRKKVHSRRAEIGVWTFARRPSATTEEWHARS